MALRGARRDPHRRVCVARPHRGPAPDHRRQPPAELPPPRAGWFHVAARPAALLEPVHLQWHAADGRLQRRSLLSPDGALRDPARSRRMDRDRGDLVLCHRGRHVRLLAGAQALDDRVRPGRGDLRLCRTGPQPGEPRRHDRGLRGHSLDAAGGVAHRPRRPLALVDSPRGGVCDRDPRRGTRGHARRGPPGRCVRSFFGRTERAAMVARPEPMRCWGRTRPFPCGDPMAPRTRGHPQLATGQRRARGGRELPDPVQHLRPGAVPRRRLRPPRRGPVLQPVQPARGRDLPGRAARSSPC